jgi:gas vesicle protein
VINVMKHSISLKASALAVGAAALLLWAPIASADDPPPCDQNSDQNGQQCQDQQKGAGIANQAIDDAKQAADQAKQAADQAKQAADQAKQGADQAKQGIDQAKQGTDRAQKSIDLADKNCWVVDGVPTMWSPALTSSPGHQPVPCYSVYGLTPH